MAISPKAVENEALSLSREDRSRLVVNLLQSIEERPISDPRQVESAWLAEADRRYQAYLRGDELAISAEVVFAELWADDH